MIDSPMVPVAPPSKKPRSMHCEHDLETSIASDVNHSLTRRRLELERLKSRTTTSQKHKSSKKPTSILKTSSRWTPSCSSTKTPYVKQQKQGIPTTVDIKRRLDFADNHSHDDKENIAVKIAPPKGGKDIPTAASPEEENCDAPKVPNGSSSSPTSLQEQFDEELLLESTVDWKAKTATSPFEFRTLVETIGSGEDEHPRPDYPIEDYSSSHDDSPLNATTTPHSSKVQDNTLKTTTTTSPLEFRTLVETLGADEYEEKEYNTQNFPIEDYSSSPRGRVLRGDRPLNDITTSTPHTSKVRDNNLKTTTTSPLEFRKLIETMTTDKCEEEEHISQDFSVEDDSSSSGESVLHDANPLNARAARKPHSSKMRDDDSQVTTSPKEFKTLADMADGEAFKWALQQQRKKSTNEDPSCATDNLPTTTLSLNNCSLNHQKSCHKHAIIPLPRQDDDGRLLQLVTRPNPDQHGSEMALYHEKDAAKNELCIIRTLKHTWCWTLVAAFVGDVLHLLSSLAWLVSVVLPWKLGRWTGLAASLIFCWWVFLADHDDNILFVTTNHYAIV